MKVALTIAIACALAHPAWAVTRYALVIGNDSGDRDEPELHYAEHDAEHLASTLVELGGFLPGDVVVLRGIDADAARAALIALNDRIRTQAAGDAMLVVYYSGHADAHALHLGATELPLAQLEQLVRGSPAGFRLLIVDACRSGALTRVKGGRAVPAFPIALGDALTADGVVFWTASSQSEQAQESDDVKGSLFSHFLLSGLAGPADLDGDGAVTTNEAYAYARAATLRASSRTLAGTQHPTFRDELAGHDGVVLTRPGNLGPRRATLRMPDDRDVLVLAGSRDGPVVAEVGVHDATRKLNVRAGRYFIRERGERHLLEGVVTLAAGDEHVVEDAELAEVDYVRVAGKGFAVLQRPRSDAVEAAALVRTPLVAGGTACVGATAGYAFDLGWLTVTPRIAGCREDARNAFVTTATDDMTVDVRLAHAWRVSRLVLAAQVEAGGGALHQAFATTGNAPARTVGTALFGGGARATLPLGHGACASIAGQLDTYVLRRDEGMTSSWSPTLAATALVGMEWMR